MIPLLAAALARAEAPPELGVVWGLTVDGEPVGTREIRVRYEGETGARVRVLEQYTEIAGGGKRKDRFAFQQRLTANSHEGSPASFMAATAANGSAIEVQARYADRLWHVTIGTDAGEETSTLAPGTVDLSTVDLFDPEGDVGIARYDHVRILSADQGAVVEGDVVPLGPSDVSVGGETLWTEGYELRTPDGAWRLWYAANGFLVKWEQPLLGRRIEALMIGSAPRAIDEFAVPPVPRVEEVPLP